jgi:hypothetical protein
MLFLSPASILTIVIAVHVQRRNPCNIRLGHKEIIHYKNPLQLFLIQEIFYHKTGKITIAIPGSEPCSGCFPTFRYASHSLSPAIDKLCEPFSYQNSSEAKMLRCQLFFQISIFESPGKALPVWSSARSTIPPGQKNQP